jgi:hypothetical protein
MDKRYTGESIEEEEKGVEVNIGNCVTTRIQRVVLDFPIVFFPFRLFAGELIHPTLIFTFDSSLRTTRIRRVVLYFPIVFIANIHSLKEVRMEEKNQQDRFLGVDREWGDDPEGPSLFVPLSGGWT